MIIPKSFYLASQTFNSEFLEFVWQFPQENQPTQQLICHVGINHTVYMEAGEIDAADNWMEDPSVFDITYEHLLPMMITNPEFWNTKKLPNVYKNFTNGVDLISLIQDSVTYLKSI